MSALPIPRYDPATLVRSRTVEIAAPARFVWEVLTDLDKYPLWNPFCITATSTLDIGAPVDMTLLDYSTGEGTFPYVEHVCAVVPERLLSWELRPTESSAQAARRDQIIDPLAADRCRYYSTDAFLGEQAQQIMAESGAWVKRAFDDTALALKQRCEGLYTPTSARTGKVDE